MNKNRVDLSFECVFLSSSTR